LYQDYWGLTEKPFENTPDPRFLYKSPATAETFAKLLYALKSNRGGVLLTGDSGCGKTTLTRALVAELDPEQTEVALLTSPSPTPTQLLREILYQVGENVPGEDHTEVVHKLNGRLYDNFSTGKSTVVIIDEGQLLEDTALFEEIRLLLNFQLNDAFLLTLLLVGQPAMAERVRQIPQLDDRLSARGIVRALERREVGEYIEHRLRVAGREQTTFSPDAIELISQYSGGIPRRLNHICDLCLVLSFSRRAESVDEDMAYSIILDEEDSRV
jgi:general secretion pathway protein A